MDVQLTREAEASIQSLAEKQGKPAEQLAGELFDRAWELVSEQEAWLAAHREEMAVKISAGMLELERGEGIPDFALDERLAAVKAHRK